MIDENNIKYVEYNASGEILCQGSAPEDIYQLNKHDRMIEGTGNPQTDYVLNGVITPRPTQQTTLDGLTLNNLPQPCQLLIDGTAYDLDTPTIELEFDEPGTYKVQILAFPYLDMEFTIET